MGMASYTIKKLKQGLMYHRWGFHYRNAFCMVCLLLPLATLKYWNGGSQVMQQRDAAKTDYEGLPGHQSTQHIQTTARFWDVFRNTSGRDPIKKFHNWKKEKTPSTLSENLRPGARQDAYNRSTSPKTMTFNTSVQHHAELPTHRLQLALASSTSAKLPDIMQRQYDVQNGTYEGKPYKKILYWNSAVTLPLTRKNNNFGLGVGRDAYERAGCPVWQCETSEDRTDLLQYDAILFNHRTWNASDLPSVRSPHQRYIFFSIESPDWDIDYESNPIPEGFFNWTMTYRWDSDVVHPYGWIEPINRSVPLHPPQEMYQQLVAEPPVKNYAAGKTRMAAAFASNCVSKSNREDVMDELVRYFRIDIYGRCGKLSCGKEYLNQTGDVETSEEESCLAMAAKNYKFFLAFHNSLCLDYVAERFYDAVRYPIIPVVIDAHGHHAKVAPPHSFINVLDFSSMRQLGEYLIKLDKNDTLYNEYFWWKKHYKLRNAVLYSGLHYRTYCSLCAALHDPVRHSNRQALTNSYADVRIWWKNGAKCTAVQNDGIYQYSFV